MPDLMLWLIFLRLLFLTRLEQCVLRFRAFCAGKLSIQPCLVGVED